MHTAASCLVWIQFTYKYDEIHIGVSDEPSSPWLFIEASQARAWLVQAMWYERATHWSWVKLSLARELDGIEPSLSWLIFKFFLIFFNLSIIFSFFWIFSNFYITSHFSIWVRMQITYLETCPLTMTTEICTYLHNIGKNISN